jgi:formate/nitrite transporter FocA (FNT family)
VIAGLLYIIGLIATVVTIVMVGYSAPALVQAFMTAIQAANPDYLAAVADLGRNLSWALGPFVGGLLIMGVGRIIFLLGAINRALRGTP